MSRHAPPPRLFSTRLILCPVCLRPLSLSLSVCLSTQGCPIRVSSGTYVVRRRHVTFTSHCAASHARVPTETSCEFHSHCPRDTHLVQYSSIDALSCHVSQFTRHRIQPASTLPHSSPFTPGSAIQRNTTQDNVRHRALFCDL